MIFFLIILITIRIIYFILFFVFFKNRRIDKILISNVFYSFSYLLIKY